MSLWRPILTTVVLASLSVAALHAKIGTAATRQPIHPYSSSPAAQRTTVLVELFTSEGCSDCPPADALLEKLDRTQPVSDADVIVLSEHVDYWNDIGWKDPYSSHAYSERQRNYAGRFGLSSVYTPQMVVDGRIQFVGSDERSAIQAIDAASQSQKIPVTLTAAQNAGNATIAAHLEVGPLPGSQRIPAAHVLLAVADESDTSSVSRGENAGRTLMHVAVVRNLAEVGALDESGAFSKDVSIPFPPHTNGNLRLVAFLQDPASGRILGVASTRLSN